MPIVCTLLTAMRQTVVTPITAACCICVLRCLHSPTPTFLIPFLPQSTPMSLLPQNHLSSPFAPCMLTLSPSLTRCPWLRHAGRRRSCRALTAAPCTCCWSLTWSTKLRSGLSRGTTRSGLLGGRVANCDGFIYVGTSKGDGRLGRGGRVGGNREQRFAEWGGKMA